MSNTVKKPLVITNDEEIALILKHRNKGVKAITLTQKAINDCPTVMSVLKFIGVKSTDIDRIDTRETTAIWDKKSNKLEIGPWGFKPENLLKVKVSYYYFNQDYSLSKVKNKKLPEKCRGTLIGVNGRAIAVDIQGSSSLYWRFGNYFLNGFKLQKESFRTDILDYLEQQIKKCVVESYNQLQHEYDRYLKVKQSYDEMVSNLGKDYDKFKPELETDVNSGSYK